MRLFSYSILLFFCHFYFGSAESNVKSVNLYDSNECKNEINEHCQHEASGTNSKILNCLQSSKKIINSLSNKCQNFIWSYRVKYLDVTFFKKVTNNHCNLELSQFSNCAGTNKDDQVICLIKHKDDISNNICRHQLKEVAAIVFSDLLIVYKFINSCSSKISELNCGRVEQVQEEFLPANYISRITSQGNTIECLVNSLEKLDDQCRRQILRLGELQSDDFHLNPNLYYACRVDREKFCRSIESGSSRIYQCLEKHKNHDAMSKNCRNALNQKNKLEAYDYKIRGQFFDRCDKEIQKHKCSNGTHMTDLTVILICLLRAERHNSLDIHCRAEVFSVRTQMASNIEMFPEFKVNCRAEIQKFCSQLQSKNDSISHCLMRNSLPALENHFNANCLTSLKNFIKIVNPTEDVKLLDPVISQACSNELQDQCSAKKFVEPNDRYECLLQLIDEERSHIKINDDCKNHLLALAQFVEQEYSLNHKLFKMCHEDAVKYCQAKDDHWRDNSGLVPHAIVHCLIRKWSIQYTNRQKPLISFKCSSELKTVMKIEAGNLMLNFKVYTACSLDLMKHCKTLPHKMDCLQINYRNLKAQCKQSISEFLSLDEEEYSLKKLIARSCSAMVRQFCNGQSGDNDNKDYMECLLRNKFDKTMDPHCKIALEHYQIIGLDNYKIDHKFARFCSKEIQQYCSNLLPNSRNQASEDQIEAEPPSTPAQVTKSQIVACLSLKLTKELLLKRNPFSAQCYEQFTFEFIQQTSSVNFDPELRKVCSDDIGKHCSTVDSESVLTCLHRYQDSLSEPCVNLLVSRQQLRSYDVNLDAGIQRYCPSMIATYCSQISSHQMFRCLRTKMRIEGFDAECKIRIIRRLERRLVDLRLNPELIDDCRTEIKANCNVTHLTRRIAEMHFNDKHHIVNCLRYVFVEHRKFLGGTCRRQVFELVLDAQSNIHLDPGLIDVCQTEIRSLCNENLMVNSILIDGQVQNCLKTQLLEAKIQNDKCSKEVYRLLREGMADVHVDPQLYGACRAEISRICDGQSLGHGRKLSCLLWAMENKETVAFVSPGCKSVLQDRKEMWEFATRMEPPKNMNEVFRLVAESESRYYFVFAFIFPVLLTLLVGVACGKYCRRGAPKVIRKRYP